MFCLWISSWRRATVSMGSAGRKPYPAGRSHRQRRTSRGHEEKNSKKISSIKPFNSQQFNYICFTPNVDIIACYQCASRDHNQQPHKSSLDCYVANSECLPPPTTDTWVSDLPAPGKPLPGMMLACGCRGGPRCAPMCICLASEDTISEGGHSSLQREKEMEKQKNFELLWFLIWLSSN